MKEIQEVCPTYEKKCETYFSGARWAFVDILPENPSGRLLEVGCGEGDTAAYARTMKKCGWCGGVELCAEPAKRAAQQMDEVIVGDIESVDLPFPKASIDVVLLSEVVEHLVNPWATLRKLHDCLKKDGIIVAGSPNVSHHSVLRMLVKGRWDYASVGIMDATHLRWFTPATYRNLFEDCGYSVEVVRPAQALRWKARILNRLFLGRISYLFMSQIVLVGRAL